MGALPELVAVPDSAPPYDCVLHGTACQQPPPSSPAATLKAWQPAEPARATDSSGVCAGPIWPRQFAQAIVETLAGLRPFRQLTGWTTEQAQARIRGLAPLLLTERPPAIVRVLASQPAAGVAEVVVIAVFGARTRALAMRFEHMPARAASPGLPSRPARWLCTTVESG